ncbi:hypothetical protein ACFSL6_25565 [Paenibacillus thailandensis]
MIVFSLLAHENEDGVMDQLKNMRRFVKDYFIVVLYNGSTDPNFGKRVIEEYEEVLVCPYSRPIKYRKTGRVFYDVARWLASERIKYDYLVYLESDTMFLGEGFRKFLDKHLEGYDYAAKLWKKFNPKTHKTSSPAENSMIKEWGLWQKYFKTDYVCKTSNPFQTYKYRTVQKILKIADHKRLELFFEKSNVECLGEMLFPTLARKCGAKVRLYPRWFRKYLRWSPELQTSDIDTALEKGKYMLAHPVKSDVVRKYIISKQDNEVAEGVGL